MKKYSDWQRYVKEQIDGMGAPGQEKPPAAPASPGQSAEKEKFVIRRTEPAAAETQPRPAPAFPPHPARKLPGAQPQPKDQQDLFGATARPEPLRDAPPEGPEPPMASPFVSVHDVWKAAEQTARSQPRQKLPPEPGLPPLQPAPQQPQAGLARPVADTQTTARPREQQPRPPARVEGPPPAAPQFPQRQTSREEIIERLVNPTISLEEAAKIMGVCKATVRRYTAMGILPHYRTPGNQRRFKLNDIILFIEDQKK